MLYIIVGIILFGLLIAVHEAGHFMTAKWMDVKVNEFSIGMGPALLSKQKGETLYSLRCLPIGGYCAMEGEDEETGDPRSFASKAPWRKVIILVAGSAMNFLAGFLIMVILFASVGAYAVPVVDGFMEGFPCAGESGLRVGDRIHSIDGHRVYVNADVSTYLNAADGEPVDMVVKRDGEKVTLRNLPLKLRDYEVDGQKVQRYGLYFAVEEATLPGVLAQSWNTCLYFAHAVWQGLGMMVTGQVGLNDMSGPVGIVSYMGQAGDQGDSIKDGLYNVFYLVALIAVNLALMNMLPFPALDGGRVFFLIVGELWFLLFRSKPDPKVEGYIHAAGMIFLLGFMAVITFSDIFKLVK